MDNRYIPLIGFDKQNLQAAINSIDEEKPILHSDRGFHYRTNSWIEIMDTSGLTRPMSKKACPLDNSACKGFFGSWTPIFIGIIRKGSRSP